MFKYVYVYNFVCNFKDYPWNSAQNILNTYVDVNFILVTWIYLLHIVFTLQPLTHWGRVMYVCINKLTIIGPDNGLLPGWRQAIIPVNSNLRNKFLLNLMRNSNIFIQANAFENVFWEMAAILSGLNVLSTPQGGQTPLAFLCP